MQLTAQEISLYREQLSDNELAALALDAIEDCEGDLEDAATSLAISVGQQLDRVDWLEGMAKRCRVLVCGEDYRSDLENNQISRVVNDLLGKNLCPDVLVAPVVIYILKRGIEDFCEPLNYQIKRD